MVFVTAASVRAEKAKLSVPIFTSKKAAAQSSPGSSALTLIALPRIPGPDQVSTSNTQENRKSFKKNEKKAAA